MAHRRPTEAFHGQDGPSDSGLGGGDDLEVLEDFSTRSTKVSIQSKFPLRTKPNMSTYSGFSRGNNAGSSNVEKPILFTIDHLNPPNNYRAAAQTPALKILQSIERGVSPLAATPITRAKPGDNSNPIEIGDVRDIDDTNSNETPPRGSSSRTYSHENDDGINSDYEDEVYEIEDPQSFPHFIGHQAARGESVIDLEDLEIIGDESDDEIELVGARALHPGIAPIYLNDIYEEEVPQRAARHRASRAPKYQQRNPPVALPLVSLESYNFDKYRLAPRKTVELNDGSFLRITHIIHNLETDDFILRGEQLKRLKDVDNMLPRQLNELCICYEVDLDDPRPRQTQGAIEVPLSEVVKLRKLRLSNHTFPQQRWLNLSDWGDKASAFDGGELTARWRYTCVYPCAADRHKNVYRERMMERLRASDVLDPIEEDVLRIDWRGTTVSGGAYLPQDRPRARSLPRGRVRIPKSLDGTNSPKRKEPADLNNHDDVVCSSKRFRPNNQYGVEDTRRKLSCIRLDGKKNDVVDLTMTENPLGHFPPTPLTINPFVSNHSTPPPAGSIRSKSISPQAQKTRLPGQKLTVGDCFCGAGGTTRGACMAGLRVLWGFDFDITAMETWQANFPLARGFCIAADEFVNLGKDGHLGSLKVDILHLSPPCQFFSPAHTTAGPNDEMNTASLFAVEELLKLVKPRAVTLEQTFGLLHKRFRLYFCALIKMFTSLNYSVTWAAKPFQEWGLPQRRYRLIILASCPGEPLLTMPPPKYAKSPPPGSFLKPFKTVNQAISRIPRDALDHNVDAARYALHAYKTPYDGNAILPRAMTCNGGNNYHPSGEREFTLREFARLQGFPDSHSFKGKGVTAIKKQIGNAVPSVVAKVLFESVKRDLDDADGIVEPTIVID